MQHEPGDLRYERHPSTASPSTTSPCTADFLVAPDDRVEFALARQVGQVAAVFLR